MPEKLEKLNKALEALLGKENFTLTEKDGKVTFELSAGEAFINQKFIHSQDELDKLLKDLGFSKENRKTVFDKQPYTGNLDTINENGLDFVNRYAHINNQKDVGSTFPNLWNISLKVVGSTDKLKDILLESGGAVYYPRELLGKDNKQAKENIDRYLDDAMQVDYFFIETKNGKDYAKLNSFLTIRPNSYSGFHSGIDEMHNVMREEKKAAEQMSNLRNVFNKDTVFGVPNTDMSNRSDASGVRYTTTDKDKVNIYVYRDEENKIEEAVVNLREKTGNITEYTYTFKEDGTCLLKTKCQDRNSKAISENVKKLTQVEGLNRFSDTIASSQLLESIVFNKGDRFEIELSKKEKEETLSYGQRKEALAKIGLLTGDEIKKLKQLENKEILTQAGLNAALDILSAWGNQTQEQGIKDMEAGTTAFNKKGREK